MEEIQINDIIQVTKENNEWFPCLVIVSEVKPWGIQGYTSIPLKGAAYIRLKKEDYELVGRAIIVAH